MNTQPGRRGATGEAMGPNVFLDERLGDLRRSRYRPSAFAAFGTALWRRSEENARARPDLSRELLWIGILGVGMSLLAGMAMVAEGVAPLPSLAVPPLAWLVLCGWVWVELGLLRHPITDAPSPAIGPANVLSLYRGWAAAPIIVLGLSLAHPSLLAVALGVTAAVTDLVDGTVAVRLGHESRLGRLLDPVLDSFLFSAIAFDLSRWGLLPWWVAALVAIRYFSVVLGGIVLLFALGRSLPVRHTPWGQRSTLAIGLALAAALANDFVAIPRQVLLGVYALTIVTMVVALLGIVRRIPTTGSADAR